MLNASAFALHGLQTMIDGPVPWARVRTDSPRDLPALPNVFMWHSVYSVYCTS